MRSTVFSGVNLKGFRLIADLLTIAFDRLRASFTIALARSRPASTDIIAGLPIGIACWDAGARLLNANAQFLADTSLDARATRPGTTYSELMRRLSLCHNLHVLADDTSGRQFEVETCGGRWLLLDERPTEDGGFVTLATDITARKRAELDLKAVRAEQRLLARRYHEEKIRAEAASRAKTSFLAHLSHDIRTPLNHIIGFADLIRHQTYGPLGDSRYLGYINDIKGSGEKLLASFAEILELAQLEGGDKLLSCEEVPVDDLIGSVFARFSGQAKRAGVTLSASRGTDALVIADRASLQRMLGNLVENAVRFTPSGGKVTLGAWEAGDGVVLEVSDTGIGIAPERLETLSHPFVLGDAMFTREHGGAGLGIAIARAIAELSGGRLAIDSSPAYGTTVAVSLPAITGSAVASRPVAA